MRRSGTLRATILSAGAFAMAGSPAARAAEDADEEPEQAVQEVFLGELAFPQEARELQFSAASSWVEGVDARVFSPLLVAEWGITDRFQVEVEAPFIVSVPTEGDTGAGIGNAELGALYNFVRSSSLGLVVSGSVSGAAPTSSTDLIDSVYGAYAMMSAYKTMGPVHASLSVEGGMEVPSGGAEEDGDSRFVTEGALSLLFPMGSVVPVAEVGFEREEGTELDVAAGFVWHASRAVEVGLAGLMTRGEDDTEWGALVNLTWERSFGVDRD